MLEINAGNAAEYLTSTGRAQAVARVEELAYGVSNVVLLIEADGNRMVLKQSRAQLRTAAPWFSDLDRIYREIDAMRALRPMLGDVVPRIMFEDRENFLFGMSAAPADAKVWKQQLLDGEIEMTIGKKAAEALATVHESTAHDAAIKRTFADATNFYQLRLEPFYLRMRDRTPKLAEPLSRLIEETQSRKQTLVHGDFSPKNILVSGRLITLVDYETVHVGDPAFDLGFFLAHLTLKAFYHGAGCAKMCELFQTFLSCYMNRITYEPEETLLPRTLRHLGAIALVRIDGTSPVDYLRGETKRATAREYAESLLTLTPGAASFNRAFDQILSDLRIACERA